MKWEIYLKNHTGIAESQSDGFKQSIKRQKYRSAFVDSRHSSNPQINRA